MKLTSTAGIGIGFERLGTLRCCVAEPAGAWQRVSQGSIL